VFSGPRLALALTAIAAVASISNAVRAQDDDPGQAAFTKICVKCHTPERIVSERRTRAQWQEVIDTMVVKGAEGTDEDFDAVMQYLLRHHGRVDVNKAPAGDMTLVLAIRPGDAEAIVSYRRSKGPFADFDALSQVPGIDVDRLAHERDALSF